MNMITFKKILETYGGNQDQWPESLREACGTLIKTSAEARALLSKEQLIDIKIMKHTIQVPPSHLCQLQKNLSQRIDNLGISLLSLFQPLQPKLAMMAIALVIGLYLGLSLPSEDNETLYLDTFLLYEDDEI